jgi:hypothetical protein
MQGMKYIFCLLLAAAILHGSAMAEDEFAAEQENATSLKENQPTSELNVLAYPNPFGNEINVLCKNAELKRVEVWNAQKHLVFVSAIEIPQGTEFSINAADYGHGYYVIKFFGENATKSILINKRSQP